MYDAEPVYGPDFMLGDFSDLGIAGMDSTGPDHFAQVTLEIASMDALRTVRTGRGTFIGYLFLLPF